MDYRKFYEDTKNLGFVRTTFDVNMKNGILKAGGTFIEDTENVGIEKLVFDVLKEYVKKKEVTSYLTYCRKLKADCEARFADYKHVDPDKFLYALEKCNIIFVENKRINYRQWRLTNGQFQFLSIFCKIERDNREDFFLPKDWKATQEEINKEIKNLEEEREYYLDYKNQFHCPSGFIRIEYQNWLNNCKKYGI
jgi:hypothetical protein